MADQLVANVDLVVWLDIPTDTFPTDRATQALEIATGWVQSYTGQRLVPVVGDVALVEARPGTTRLWLPERPVTAVTSVVYNGVTYAGAGAYWTLRGDSLSTGYWGDTRYGAWSTWPQFVTVTYSHGYTTCPQAIRGVILSAATRTVTNPQGLRSHSTGQVSWTMGGTMLDGAAGLSESEKIALAPYRAPLVA